MIKLIGYTSDTEIVFWDFFTPIKTRGVSVWHKAKKNRRQKIYNSHKGICYLCGLPVDFNEFTIDHVIPLSKGGVNALKNLRPTHKRCNNKKADKII